MNALVAENGSYIVRPCGHDLHGPTILITVTGMKFIPKIVLGDGRATMAEPSMGRGEPTVAKYDQRY